MEADKISPRQLWLWVLGAQAALLTVGAGHTGWLSTGLTGVIFFCLTAAALKIPYEVLPGFRLFWGLEWFWALVMLSSLLWQCGDCWESSGVLIPLVLLALASGASWKTSTRPAQVGSILTWLLGLIYAVILVSGIGGIHLGLIQTTVESPELLLMLGFLLPCATVLLPRADSGRAIWYYVVSAVLAVAISILTMGTLSFTVAAEQTNAFYEAVRGMSLFGVTERFESLLSVAMTMSWYSALSLLTAVAGEAAHRTVGKRWWGVAGAAAAAAIQFIASVSLPMKILFWGCFAAWWLLPLLVTGRKWIRRS